MSTTEAVFFDLDDTLCVSNQSDEDIYREVFERAGIEPFFTLSDVRSVDSAEIETAESDVEFYRNLYRATVRELPTDLDSELLTELAEVTVAVIDHTDVSFRAGAEEALRYASDQYEMGLITNGGRQTQTAKLETLGIDDVFDTMVFCDPSVGIDPKPAQEPFQRALSSLSVSATSSIYVGDDHSADIVGAQEAGLNTVWVPPEHNRETRQNDPEPKPTHVLDSLSELPTVL